MERGSRCFHYSPQRCDGGAQEEGLETPEGEACTRNKGSKATCQGPHPVSPGATVLGSLSDQFLVTPVPQRPHSRAVTSGNHKPEVNPKDKKIHPQGKSGDIRATGGAWNQN